MKDIKHYLLLVENATKELRQEKLSYGKKDLNPVLSDRTLDYHYGKLAKGYVDRFNKGEGDADFNYGGAVLHNIYFPQFKKAGGSSSPTGASKELIERKYKSFNNFKEEFAKIAMAVKGSGWVYMDPNGDIKVIPNHEYKKSMKISLLVDWWEHAWALDYEHDKAKYLNNIWRIIDWSVINDRLQGE
jgi:Fe-Mn family superoxide dismutase